MATQNSGINASLPPVSYIKAIDIWTGVCLTFVFGALLEFAFVNYASRNEDREKQTKQCKWDLERAEKIEDATIAIGMNPLVPADLNSMATKFRECETHMSDDKKRRGCFISGKWWLSRFPTRSKRIDVISRICFPLAFAFFNILYWSLYLVKKDQEE